MTNNSLPQITELLLPDRTADSRSSQPNGGQAPSPASVEQFEKFLKTASNDRQEPTRAPDRRPSPDLAADRRADSRPDRDPSEPIAKKRPVTRDRVEKNRDRRGPTERDDEAVREERQAAKDGEVKTDNNAEPKTNPKADDDAAIDPEKTETGDAETDEATAEAGDASDLLHIVEIDSGAVDESATESTETTAESSTSSSQAESAEDTLETVELEADAAAADEEADPTVVRADGAELTVTAQPNVVQQVVADGDDEAAVEELAFEATNRDQASTDGHSAADGESELAAVSTTTESDQSEATTKESTATDEVEVEAEAASDTGDQSDQQAADGSDGGQEAGAEDDSPAPLSAIATPSGQAAAGSATTTTTNAIAGIGDAATIRDGGQVAGTQATNQAEQADGADPLWRQVRRALGSLRNLPTGEQQLTIRLRPDDLGSVVIRISTGEAGTTVALVAESAAAASQLNQQRQSLIDDLQEGGLRGVAVDVGTSNTGQPQGEDNESDVDQSGTGHPSALAGVSADGELPRNYRGRSARGSSEGLIDVDL